MTGHGEHTSARGDQRNRLTPAGVVLVALVLLAALLPATAASAVPIVPLTWSGPDSGLWSDAANWTPPLVPANGDNLVFNGSGRTVNNIAALNIDTITINTGTGRVIAQQGAGALTITGGITYAGNATIDHPLTLDSGQRTITGPVSGSDTLTVSKGLHGFGGVTIAAPAVVFSGEASDYAGSTIVNRGRLSLQGPATLGTVGAGTTVADGATLSAVASSVPLAEPLTLDGRGADTDLGALYTGALGPDVTGPVQLSALTRIRANRISGKISGPGPLEIHMLAGGYSRINNGGNDFSGGTTVVSGFAVPGASGAMGTGAIDLPLEGGLHIAGGVVIPNGVTAATGEAEPNSTVDLIETGLGGGGIGSLTTSGNGSVYRRVLVNHPMAINGGLHGTGWIIGVGNVPLTLGPGSSSFTGRFDSFGLLTLDGYRHDLGNVLAGGIVDLGARPDGSVGGLDASTLVVDGGAIRPRFAGAGPAAGSSLIRVASTVRLNNAVLDVAFAGSFPVGRSVTLIDNRGSGAIDGTFIGLGEGAFVSDGGANFRITYVGGTGNDVVLTRTAGRADRNGYWMVGRNGAVYSFGEAPHLGNAPVGSRAAVDLESTPTGSGYWIVDERGNVFSYGDAGFFGGSPTLNAGETVTSLSATPTGLGYWLFTTKGRVVPHGDAGFFGDVSKMTLNGPVLDSVPTPSGKGYYMVASDGGVFAFGDAVFVGSMGGQRLNQPVQSLVPDADGSGYWLVAADGGIFAFQAGFYGSVPGALGPGQRLNQMISGMVGSATGGGYLMVAADGGIFAFGDVIFRGSLGSNPPTSPIVAAATLPQ